MSAAASPRTGATRAEKPRRQGSAGGSSLRALAAPGTERLGNAGFVIVLVSLLVAGMVGLLALNTQIQDRAFTVNQLAHEAQSTSDEQAKLSGDLDRAAATTKLMERAGQLGMVPADTVGYLLLSDASVQGKPKPITGAALPHYRTSAQHQADAKARAEAEAKAKADAEAKAKADEEAKAKADADAKASPSPGASATPSASPAPAAPRTPRGR